MNSFTNTILTLLLGWLRTLLNAIRDFVSSDSSTAFFDFFRQNWRALFLVLCIVGFSLDIVVYLARWRPRMLSRRRRRRRAPEHAPLPEAYDGGDYGPDYGTEDEIAYAADSPAIPTREYAPAFDDPENGYGAAPTAQYQIQSRQNTQTQNVPPATLPYTTPYFAPEANAYRESAPALYTDSPAPDAPYTADQPQRFAFGMAPSFGSAQSEPPAYHYQRDAAPSFAPPQYAQDYGPADSFAPPGGKPAGGEPMEPQAYDSPSPYFRPFSDRGEPRFSPQRTRGLGAVAKKARTLFNADEAYDSMSYQDLQPTVDVSKAFHSPVYPEKKNEGDA